jgi:hypothetical protein
LKKTAQRGGRISDRDPGVVEGVAEELVDHAVVALHGDRDGGRGEALSILLSLVAEGVVLGSHDEGGRETAQIRLEKRRHQGVELVRLASEIVIHEPLLRLSVTFSYFPANSVME